ncbi:MAG: hypothetical protein PHF84_03285 [bacterium]|nr:hypothetical protein [bacterium]
MKDWLSIFKKPGVLNNIIYLAYGLIVFLFRYMNKTEVIFLLLIIIIANNFIIKKKIVFLSGFRAELRNLNWVFIPVFFYALIMPDRIIGLLLISNIFSDRIARLVRAHLPPLFFRYLRKGVKGTIAFILSNFIISLMFFYFLSGYLIIRDVVILFIISVAFGFLENIRIMDLPDNFNLNIFGSVLIILCTYIDFHFRFSTLNFVFGSFICVFITLIFILLDFVNLRSSYIYYLYFVLFYTSMGYFLFIFNALILLCMGVLQKMKVRYSFIDLYPLKNYFYLSLMIILAYFFIPHLPLIRSALVTGLITGLLHYAYHLDVIDEINSKFNSVPLLKKMAVRLSPWFERIKFINKRTFFFNNLTTLLLLLIALYLNLVDWTYLLLALICVNLTIILYDYLRKKYIISPEWVKFLIVYIPFKLVLLI